MRVASLVVMGSLSASWLGAQSAIGDLEAASRQKVQRFQSSGSMNIKPVQRPSQTRTPVPNPSARLMTGVFGQMLSSAFQATPASVTTTSAARDSAQMQLEVKLEQQRQDDAERGQQELRNWADNYSSQLNRALDAQQRGDATLEDVSAAASGPWDGRSAPNLRGELPIMLDAPAVVDLSQSKTLTPSLLRDAKGAKRTQVTADEVLKRRELAQEKLKRMMEENKDLKTMGKRFYELEDELSRLKREATHLGTEARTLQRDFDGWGWQVDKAVQDALQRGLSLLTGTIVPDGTSDGLKTLRKNPKLWGETMESLASIHDFSEFVNEMGDRFEAAKQAIDWAQAKRNLSKDLDFVASNLGNANPAWKAMSTQWELGKSIVGSGLDVAQELDAWGNMNNAQGELKLVKVDQQIVQRKMGVLIGELQKSRTAIADKLGLKPEDLIPAPKPTGLGSNVPPL